MSVSGKFMTATLNGVAMSDNYGWQAEEGGDMLDRTTGSDGGWENEDVGVQNLRVTVKGYYDLATGVVGGFRQGSLLTDVGLWGSSLDAEPRYLISLMVVARFTLGGEVRGRMEWTAELHSKGAVVGFTD